MKKHYHSVCFEVKYYPENVFPFSGVCLHIKCGQNCKIISVTGDTILIIDANSPVIGDTTPTTVAKAAIPATGFGGPITGPPTSVALVTKPPA